MDERNIKVRELKALEQWPDEIDKISLRLLSIRNNTTSSICKSLQIFINAETTSLQETSLRKKLKK